MPVPDQHWKPGKRAKKNGKPPLHRKGKRAVPVLLYLDDDYWDARMTDVD